LEADEFLSRAEREGEKIKEKAFRIAQGNASERRNFAVPQVSIWKRGTREGREINYFDSHANLAVLKRIENGLAPSFEFKI
jgi:hypothetical protein